MNRMQRLLATLKKKEPQAIAKVMAFMSYNPSIGRVLDKGAVQTFQSMAVRRVRKLSSIYTIEEFDKFHRQWISQFIKRIRNNRQEKCSVGQAQKAINVFLKVYVDWARLPDRLTADRIAPYIHVPLDSILMKSITRRFPNFKKDILETRQVRNYSHSLSKIERTEYDRWQHFFFVSRIQPSL